MKLKHEALAIFSQALRHNNYKLEHVTLIWCSDLRLHKLVLFQLINATISCVILKKLMYVSDQM